MIMRCSFRLLFSTIQKLLQGCIIEYSHDQGYCTFKRQSKSTKLLRLRNSAVCRFLSLVFFFQFGGENIFYAVRLEEVMIHKIR